MTKLEPIVDPALPLALPAAPSLPPQLAPTVPAPASSAKKKKEKKTPKYITNAQAAEVATATREALFLVVPECAPVLLPGRSLNSVRPAVPWPMIVAAQVRVSSVAVVTRKQARKVEKKAVKALRTADGRAACEPNSKACKALRQLVRVVLATLVEVV